MASSLTCGQHQIEHADIHDSVFRDVNLANSHFNNINLSGTKFHDINMANVNIDNANLTGMKINGVLVTDMLDAYRKQVGQEN